MSQLPEIIRDIERVDAQVVQRAAGFQAAILADVAGRRGTMHARVAPVHQGMKVAGPAFTVEVRPGDNLMIDHVAGLQAGHQQHVGLAGHIGDDALVMRRAQ